MEDRHQHRNDADGGARFGWQPQAPHHRADRRERIHRARRRPHHRHLAQLPGRLGGPCAANHRMVRADAGLVLRETPRILFGSVIMQVDTNKAWGPIVCSAFINSAFQSQSCPPGNQISIFSPTPIRGLVQAAATLTIDGQQHRSWIGTGADGAPSAFPARASGGAAKIVIAWDATSTTGFRGTHEGYYVGIRSGTDAKPKPR